MRILALVHVALRDVIMHIQFAIVAEVYGEVFAVQLAWVSEQELPLLFRKEQFTEFFSAGGSVLRVPRMRLRFIVACRLPI